MNEMFIVVFVLSLGITLFVMPRLIELLKRIKIAQSQREEGLESHKVKAGTPIMGGLAFVIIPVVISVVLRPRLIVQMDTLLIILAYLGYATIGFIDDYLIAIKRNNEGLSPKVKFLMQTILAVIFYLMYLTFGTNDLWIPIIEQTISIGPLYFIIILIMFTAESNAVNLTDGLDGLCAGTVLIALVPFILLGLHKEANDIVFLLLAVSGSLLAYLRYNLHPAKIFMGDTGSLALGGLLAAVALVLKMEVLLIIIGGVFVIETLSVTLQVLYFKKTGKRIFKMAPIHHHFEKSGMREVQVVSMFYFVAIIFALLGYFIGVL